MLCKRNFPTKTKYFDHFLLVKSGKGQKSMTRLQKWPFIVYMSIVLKGMFSRELRLLTHFGFFSKTGSDTFGSVLIYGKEQESRQKIITVQKIDLPESV